MTYSTLEINISNIVSNYKAIRKYVDKNVNVAAVVKCNCYGLSIAKVVPELFRSGCSEFYVANIYEGIAIRNAIKTARIFILNGVGKGEEEEFLKFNLIPVLNNTYQINIWSKAAEYYNKKLLCVLQIDSGMTRTGVDVYMVKNVLDDIAKNKFLGVYYILSHLACAGNVGSDMNKRQLKVMQSLRNQYPHFKYSFSNSAGIFLGKEYLFDQVRPGTMLYGVNSSTKNIPINLLSVVRLTSKIIDIHYIKNTNIQKTVGYGATYQLKAGMVTATIPVGYGDGYPRSASNKGYCYIENFKIPIIGEISMDLLCLDISNIPEQFQKIDQEVELIGDNISIKDLANLANTTRAEILTSLGSRYKIKYNITAKSTDMHQV